MHVKYIFTGTNNGSSRKLVKNLFFGTRKEDLMSPQNKKFFSVFWGTKDGGGSILTRRD